VPQNRLEYCIADPRQRVLAFSLGNRAAGEVRAQLSFAEVKRARTTPWQTRTNDGQGEVSRSPLLAVWFAPDAVSFLSQIDEQVENANRRLITRRLARRNRDDY
jgi:hypothetical protein